ncbi:MAG TPA: hypothetical protein PK634_10515 [Kiritimatiellia bacterium]|nr:hypothetical protein [Kiritimatiellia bacterium]
MNGRQVEVSNKPGRESIMRLRFGLVAGLLGAVAVLCVSCVRETQRTVEIKVPGMQTERDVRIVTNAALNEAVGRATLQHGYDICVDKGTMFYYEGARLLSREYQRHILRCLREIGYEARIVEVRHWPAPAMPTPRGWLQAWPDRHAAAISIPAMKTGVDAHRVVGAIARARAGDDPLRVAPDPAAHAIRVTYDTNQLALKNLEGAIANAGYQANDTPPSMGLPDSFPVGWTPIWMYCPLATGESS